MTAVPIKSPLTLKTSSVQFKTESGTVQDFSEHISAVTFNSTFTTASFVGCGGKVKQAVGAPQWTVGIEHIQDIDPTSFMRFLLANHGKSAQMLTTFANGQDPCLLDVVITVPTAAGGKAEDALLTSGATLPIEGFFEFKKGASFR